MTDVSLELQGAAVTVLKADAAVTAIASTRIFDSVPPSPAFPYVTLGEAQEIAEKADCYDGAEVFLTLHAWSRAVGFPEVKRLAASVKAALDDVPLTLSDHRLVSLLHQGTQYLTDPDGLTRHAVITFHALTEPI